MKRNHVLGMVCGYYLSRCDKIAYASLGYGNQQQTHEALSRIFQVPAVSIKNWRDEFDPVHDNPRLGWHKREMYPSRRRTIEALGGLSEGALLALVRSIAADPSADAADKLVGVVAGIDDGQARGRGAFGLRGPTGIKAELAFCDFYHRTNQPHAGTLVDRRHDQCGFDFQIQSKEGDFAVEVKGLAEESGGVTFTDKEWTIARGMKDRYYLAFVQNVAAEPRVWLLRDPARHFNPKMRAYSTIQVSWSVGQKNLRRVQSGTTN